MPQLFNVALIGAGGIANAHKAAIDALDHAKLVGVVDTSDAARARFDAPGFAGVDALHNEARPDAAVVCTPPSVRADVIGPLLEAGVAVLCEKPLARTHDEARALVDLVSRHDASGRAFVGYCHRFAPAVVEMRRRLVAGELGEAVRFENTFACWHPTMETGWMSDEPVSGGGAFLDTGCHSLDLFRFVLGEPAGGGDVRGALFHKAWPGRGESNATVLLAGAGGAAGVIQSGWQEPERFTVTLVGTRGLLGYDYMNPSELAWRPSDPQFGEPATLAVESHEVRFSRQLGAFLSAASGGEAGDLCTFAEAAEVQRLTDAARKSAVPG